MRRCFSPATNPAAQPARSCPSTAASSSPEASMEILSSILARNARLVPNRMFLVTDNASFTYRTFAEATARMANVLAAQGIGKGDKVGLYLP
ncbi:AMP-binding protein, partial [Rhizobiaceae sp. 2RAB30]